VSAYHCHRELCVCMFWKNVAIVGSKGCVGDSRMIVVAISVVPILPTSTTPHRLRGPARAISRDFLDISLSGSQNTPRHVTASRPSHSASHPCQNRQCCSTSGTSAAVCHFTAERESHEFGRADLDVCPTSSKGGSADREIARSFQTEYEPSGEGEVSRV
jgi:hypothetical protein